MSGPLGFVGTGQLGGAMALQLMKLGHTAIGYDVSAAALEPLKAAGATIAASALEVADKAEIVFVCLPAPEISHKVALGPDGVMGGKAMKILVELSTLGIPTVKEIAAGLGAKGVAVLDCPVIGGGGGGAIATGKFATISAGPRAAFDQVKPILESMTKSVFYVGEEHGQAQVCKVINNAIGITGFTIACEAITMGVKAGIEPQQLIDIINSGSGRNVFTETRFTNSVFKRKFDGGHMAIPLKDLSLYVETLHEFGLPAMVGSNIKEIWQGAVAENPTRGYSSIIQVFEKFAGIEVKS